MKDYKKKIRIQLFDPDFNQVSDRLLEQGIELRNGPKEVHKGPLKLEVCLFSKEDVDSFKDYISKLQGDLPIETHKKRGRKRLKVSSPDYRDQFVGRLKAASESGEAMAFLREQGFIFTSIPLLKDLGLPITFPDEIEHSDYKWMVKLLREAKNPLNNKYDVSLLVGTVRKKKTSYLEICVVSAKEILGEFQTELNPKEYKVPLTVKVRFPKFLTADERIKLSFEIAHLKKDPEDKPSKLYKRWIHAVAMENKGRGISLPLLDSIPNPFV